MTPCRSCAAPLLWVLTQKGRRMPLDAAPTADGTVVRLFSPTADGNFDDPFPSRSYDAATDEDAVRYTPHFATCPQAAAHRKGTRP